MKNVFIGVLFFSIITCTCVSLAAPEPAIVPGPDIWTLDTKFTTPLPIIIKIGNDGKSIRFWYIIITITNNTRNDVDFHPVCDLMTDTFEVVPAGKSVPSIVFNQLKQRYQRTYPFLELIDKTDNKVLQGEDNTKDIAIIWPDFDTKARNITIFISGLSNETAVIDHPVEKDQDGTASKVFLRKTLELSYSLKGDPASGNDIGMSFTSKRWIMR
jgi:hypothetical protein